MERQHRWATDREPTTAQTCVPRRNTGDSKDKLNFNRRGSLSSFRERGKGVQAQPQALATQIKTQGTGARPTRGRKPPHSLLLLNRDGFHCFSTSEELQGWATKQQRSFEVDYSSCLPKWRAPSPHNAVGGRMVVAWVTFANPSSVRNRRWYPAAACRMLRS